MSVAPSPPLPERRTGVAYDEYVRLRDDPEYDGRRMAYLDGVLEIISPEFRHERGGYRLHHLVVSYCEAFDVACEAAGSTTFRKGVPGTRAGAGHEPDQSFYLREAAALAAARETLDLAADPPPSLWIEVENTSGAVPRLPLFAALGVPEVWRYKVREHALWFGLLVGGVYDSTAASSALPGLTPALVLDALAHGRTLPISSWVRWLRDTWLPAHRRSLLDAGAGR